MVVSVLGAQSWFSPGSGREKRKRAGTEKATKKPGDWLPAWEMEGRGVLQGPRWRWLGKGEDGGGDQTQDLGTFKS